MCIFLNLPDKGEPIVQLTWSRCFVPACASAAIQFLPSSIQLFSDSMSPQAIVNIPEYTSTMPFQEQQQKVGWQDGPTQRGTLTLLYQCLVTIFTCTWTILHLNVPSENDSTLRKTSRKMKWMVFTILFPEFVLVKAILELRLALNTLSRLSTELEANPGLFEWEPYEIKPSVDSPDQRLNRNWKWTANYGRGLEFLSRLLRVGQHEAINLQDGHNVQDHTVRTKKREWTLTHSYYANMGGIVAHDGAKLYEDGSLSRRDYLTITGEDLPFNSDGLKRRHPLREIAISQEDIKDKSKADWIAKAVAVSQITWVVLSVIVRSRTGAPVTQLEIATLSFSVLAIATYMANWWKPKDISQPTVLQMPTHIRARQNQHIQRFFSILLPPLPETKIPYLRRPLPRVRNDSVWMDGDVPLIWGLLAIASLVFGGLHCIAWSSDFPTYTEKIAWRIASLVSGGLPAAALASTFALSRLSGLSADRRCTTDVSNILGQFPKEWWEITEIPDVGFEDEDWKIIWSNTRPHGDIDEEEAYDVLLVMVSRMRTLVLQWKVAREITADRSSHELFWASACALRRYPELEDLPEISIELWRQYERHFIGRTSPDISFWDHAISKKSNITSRISLTKRLRYRSDQASRIINICGILIYTTARLILIALIFSCLRSVPDGVYKVTD